MGEGIETTRKVGRDEKTRCQKGEEGEWGEEGSWCKGKVKRNNKGKNGIKKSVDDY